MAARGKSPRDHALQPPDAEGVDTSAPFASASRCAAAFNEQSEFAYKNRGRPGSQYVLGLSRILDANSGCLSNAGTQRAAFAKGVPVVSGARA